MFRYLITVIGIAVMAGSVSCGDKSTNGDGEFWVQIIDRYGDPIEGAHIELFEYGVHVVDSCITNSMGFAYCSGNFKDGWVHIFKNNYYTRTENGLRIGTYTLTSTPLILNELGDVEGRVLKMNENLIMSVADGQYHIYGFDEYGVSEQATGDFPTRSISYGMDFKFYDNLLWYTSGGDGIYVYDLTNLSNPQQIAHHEIEGVSLLVAKNGSLLAVCSYHDGAFIHLFEVVSPGNIEEIETFEFADADAMEFLNGYLVIHNDYGSTTVLNVQDPNNVEEIYSGSIYENSEGFFHGDTLVLVRIPDIGGSDRGVKDHYMVAFDDPANPQVAYHIFCEARITSFINDTLALTYYSILNRTSLEEFEVAAVISESPGLNSFGHPPYFVIGGKAWKLVD